MGTLLSPKCTGPTKGSRRVFVYFMSVMPKLAGFSEQHRTYFFKMLAVMDRIEVRVS
jgi:hypothetical protein